MQQLPDYNMQPPEYPEGPECTCECGECETCEEEDCECKGHWTECSLCGTIYCHCDDDYEKWKDDYR